jgi:hypothetical protein
MPKKNAERFGALVRQRFPGGGVSATSITCTTGDKS